MTSNGAADGRNDLPWKNASLVACYHLALFLVIISYYALILALALMLLAEGIVLIRGLFAPADGPGVLARVFLFLPATVLISAILARAVPMLWVQLKGLVTAQHDENDSDALLGVELPRSRYPEIHAQVWDIARRVHCPAPDEIRITPEPECHAVEVRRFSIMGDRRLVLVLGMPHLCVLTTSELDVILAHELSHVRAGDTRLGVFVFRFLKSLERGVESMEKRRWPWTNFVYPLSLFYLAIFRPLTAPLVRRQELLADATSASTCGADVAVGTLLKEWQIGHQFHTEVASYGPDGESDQWRGLFTRFRENWREFSDEGRAYLQARLEDEEQPSFWDSHPLTSVRIATMKRFALAEIPSQTPAYELLPDFVALEQSMSRKFAQKLLVSLHSYEAEGALADEPASENRAATNGQAVDLGDQQASDDTGENVLDETVRHIRPTLAEDDSDSAIEPSLAKETQ